jgi:hypothetical protein
MFLFEKPEVLSEQKTGYIYIIKIILTPFSTKFQAQFLTYGNTVIPEGMKYCDDA